MPVFYSPGYNISLFGIEKLHSFDSCKYEKVFAALKTKLPHLRALGPSSPVSDADLASIHTERYLSSLDNSTTIATIAEVPPAACVPAWLLKSRVLQPFRLQTAGTVEAALHAMKTGFAVNLGGGFHHASSDAGHGFCFYADITLAIKKCRERISAASAVAMAAAPKFLIVDLDAHQGDGHEIDFASESRAEVRIFDCFTPGIFPNDRRAMRRIDVLQHFQYGDDGKAFLAELRAKLAAELDSFKPDLIIYNAGTDILDGDPLSGLSISRECVIARDEIVFELAGFPSRDAGASAAAGEVGFPAASVGTAPASARRFVPVVFLLSGGYQKKTAAVISDSLLNLNARFGVLEEGWKASKEALPFAAAIEAKETATAAAAAGAEVKAGGKAASKIK